MSSPDAQKQYIIHASEGGLQRRYFNSLAREGESVLDNLLAFENDLLSSLVYFFKELYLPAHLRTKLLTHPLWEEVLFEIEGLQNNKVILPSKPDPSLKVWRSFSSIPEAKQSSKSTFQKPNTAFGKTNLVTFYSEKKKEFDDLLDRLPPNQVFEVDNIKKKYAHVFTEQEWGAIDAFVTAIPDKPPTAEKVKQGLLFYSRQPILNEKLYFENSHEAVQWVVSEKLLPRVKGLLFTGYETVINLVAGHFIESLQRRRTRFDHQVLPLSWPFLILVAPLRSAFLAAIHLHLSPRPKRVAIFQFKEGAVESALDRVRRFQFYINSTPRDTVEIRVEFPNKRMNFSSLTISKKVFPQFLHLCFIQCENNRTFYNRWCTETGVSMDNAYSKLNELEKGFRTSSEPKKEKIDLSHW